MKTPFLLVPLLASGFASCASTSSTAPDGPSKIERATMLVESLESGDPAPIAFINPDKYIQHNLAAADGLAGFAEVIQHAPPGGFKAQVVRAFGDGDMVVTHTKYDFFGPKVGFDIFRFEDGLIVEHWDNLAAIQPPNPSGRTQLDGPTEITDLERTDANKALVRDFVETALVGGDTSNLTAYISPTTYLQHNVAVADGLEGLGAALQTFAERGLVMEYSQLHQIHGMGNFVLTVSEGRFGAGDHVAYYDLFRVENGLIVEHWDVIETIPERSTWKNENGKF